MIKLIRIELHHLAPDGKLFEKFRVIIALPGHFPQILRQQPRLRPALFYKHHQLGLHPQGDVRPALHERCPACQKEPVFHGGAVQPHPFLLFLREIPEHMIVAFKQTWQSLHQIAGELLVQKIAVDLLRGDGPDLFLKQFKKLDLFSGFADIEIVQFQVIDRALHRDIARQIPHLMIHQLAHKEVLENTVQDSVQEIPHGKVLVEHVRL